MVELKERLAKEALMIGIIGPTGVGKTTISGELSKRLNIPSVEERFTKNPFLESFYENPKRWSYKSQTWFFAEKILQLRGLDYNHSQIVDPALEMDLIYAQTLHKIHFMEQRESDLYQNTFDEVYSFLQERKLIRKPDVFLVLNAPADVLEQRIRKRGRSYEMLMLNKYPSYLANLKRNVEIFSNSKSINIDAGEDSFTNDEHINDLIGKITSSI